MLGFLTGKKKIISASTISKRQFGLVCVYGISTFVGYLTPNPFLFQTIQSSMSTQFVKNISISNYSVYSKTFLFQTIQLYITISFSVGTVSMSKTVQFQTIQFSISTQFKCKYSLIVKNISISSYSVKSSSSNSANSVQYKYRFCLHTVNCQNSSILNNLVQCKYSFNVKKQFYFK